MTETIKATMSSNIELYMRMSKSKRLILENIYAISIPISMLFTYLAFLSGQYVATEFFNMATQQLITR
jgi:hypothetical protein